MKRSKENFRAFSILKLVTENSGGAKTDNLTTPGKSRGRSNAGKDIILPLSWKGRTHKAGMLQIQESKKKRTNVKQENMHSTTVAAIDGSLLLLAHEDDCVSITCQDSDL